MNKKDAGTVIEHVRQTSDITKDQAVIATLEVLWKVGVLSDEQMDKALTAVGA